ncbi:putative eka-like protein [Erysiphe necator]|uniref:Putative eka-like protein n=1 Tax=Uncinula necator TaxID=52586 RepID=A0A0B1P591_UNCNE|nr:putative eka-like protein [Erysiphe necator]
MELDVDSIAPSTTARSTPSTPLAPPAQPPLPPLTTSSNIVVNEEGKSSHVPRTILDPVAPSKRAAQYFTDGMTQSLRDEAQHAPAYLPKELQAIIQRRQDQERAWHVRLSKFASVICNVESTLEMYKRDIEKQEAEFIRNYIRKAIARLASSDNSPKPPQIPMNTKPCQTKDRCQEKDSEKNNPPTGLYKPPKDTPGQNSWAIVARNGHKKSRVTTTTPLVSKNISTGDQQKPSTSSKSTMNKNIKSKNAKEISPDSRLLLRLPANHEWRNLSPADIREVIVKCLAVSPASIGLIKPVRNGFAISTSNSGAREALLQIKIGLLDTGAKLEPASN